LRLAAPIAAAALALGLLASAASAQPRHPIQDERVEPAPAPAPPPADKAPPQLHEDTLPAPTNLAATTDEPTCSQHGGLGAGLACKAVFPAGQLVLVWSWPGHAALTGYRIYQVNANARQLVGSQTQGDGKAPYTIYIFQNVPAAGYGNACYVATAYSGDSESPQSAQFCIGSHSVVQTATLAPAQMRSISIVTSATQTTDSGWGMVSGNTTTTINENLVANSLPVVGFNSTGYSLARTGVDFDLTPYMYKTIKSARLNMSVTTSVTNTPPDGPNLTDHYTSCIAQIGIGLDQWWTFSDWIDVAVVQPNAQQMGPEVSFDVTPIVQKWASGSPNNGFVLMGAADAGSMNVNSLPSGAANCLTVYRADDIKLVVEYN